MSNNTTANLQDITGKGLAFPLQLNNGRGVISTGMELIMSSIKSILGFEYGERYFLYEFGILLREYLDDPNDDVLKTFLEYQFQTQIPQWDKRVRILELDFERPNDSTLKMKIKLGLVGTDIAETFVFPYYTNIIY